MSKTFAAFRGCQAQGIYEVLLLLNIGAVLENFPAISTSKRLSLARQRCSQQHSPRSCEALLFWDECCASAGVDCEGVLVSGSESVSRKLTPLDKLSNDGEDIGDSYSRHIFILFASGDSLSRLSLLTENAVASVPLTSGVDWYLGRGIKVATQRVGAESRNDLPFSGLYGGEIEKP